MSMPNALRAYQDCEKMFNIALSGAKGARFKLNTEDECINLRTRLHYYRKLDREANEIAYPLGEPLHGQSVYDEYTVQIIPEDGGNAHWLYITKRGANILAVETLDADHTLIDLEDYNEVKLIGSDM